MIRVYYPQTLLEECKYKVKGKTVKRYVTEGLTNSESNFDSNFHLLKKLKYYPKS